MSPINNRLKKSEQRLRNGDVAGALYELEAVLQRAPANPEALHLLGIARLMTHDAAGAVAPFERILQSDPRNGATLDNLGLAYLQLGRIGDAARVLRVAAALPGAPASVFMRLGSALMNMNDLPGATQNLRRAVTLAPGDADCRLNLGQALYRADEIDAARAEFEAVLRIAPGHADAMFNLGVIELNQGNLGDAATWFEKAIAQSPGHAEAWVNLGIVREREQRLEDALKCHRQALQINPRLPAAACNVAHLLVLLQRHSEAREQYLAALPLAPDDVAVHAGLAASCIALGRNSEAIRYLRFTVQAEPANQGALHALSSALFELGQLDEAEALARRVLALNPQAVNACATLANLLLVRGHIDQSIAVLEEAHARTGDGELLGMLTYQYRQVCDWPKWRDAWRTLEPLINDSAALGSPFWLLCEPISPAQQLHYTQAWARARFGNAGVTPPPAREVARNHQRLRIGYLSSDFQEHAAAYLIADVVEHHDRSQFEIFAYSHGPEDASPMRRRLRAAFEHFVDIAWEPDDVAAERIRNDRIDVLVDLKGYTVGDRLSIMARRPCDIQITWLGYPGTTGAPFIDYLIADPYIIREGEETTCSERVLRLPHCYQPNDRKREIATPLDRAGYGLPQQALVFCCLNQTYKITPDVFAVWMRLLQRVPHSVLWLLDSNRWASDNLAAAARQHGVAAERLIFAPHLPYARHLARYRVADLVLDTLPYTSHTTLSDALWCGCPAVGLSADTFAARVSGSVLTAAQLGDLVTGSLADYEQLAYRIATDAALLTQLRQRLERARDSAPLFDSAAFARALEALYRQVTL